MVAEGSIFGLARIHGKRPGLLIILNVIIIIWIILQKNQEGKKILKLSQNKSIYSFIDLLDNEKKDDGL